MAKQPNNTPIYSSNSRIIGHVAGATFYKRVARSRHFLRQPPAIAFDVDSLAAAERAGAERVDVLDVEGGKHYKASIATIWREGRRLNRGYGEQIYLRLDLWNRQPPAQQRSFFDVLRVPEVATA